MILIFFNQIFDCHQLSRLILRTESVDDGCQRFIWRTTAARRSPGQGRQHARPHREAGVQDHQGGAGAHPRRRETGVAGPGRSRVAAVGVNDPDFEFFQRLIENHPENFRKFGLGVRGFEVRENLLNRGALDTYADVVGHGLVDFSWFVFCGTERPCSLRSAMRMSVRRSLAEFRKHATSARRLSSRATLTYT